MRCRLNQRDVLMGYICVWGLGEDVGERERHVQDDSEIPS